MDMPVVAIPEKFAYAKDNDGNYLGVTQRQEVFAQLIAQYPETAINVDIAAELYRSIPGTEAETNSIRIICKRYLDNPRVQKRIDLYRIVYNTSKPRLLAEREEITQEMKERWRDDKAAVRSTDILQALRDRDLAYGIGRGAADEITVVLSNPRVQEGIKLLDNSNDANVIAATTEDKPNVE